MTTPNTTNCLSCGGTGWLGGPSYYNPGEGGEPCTDCALTEADREEMDMAIHRYKQNGGPARDNQDRAVKLELQWSEAARLGGWRL